jgi:hypothetical protein
MNIGQLTYDHHPLNTLMVLMVEGTSLEEHADQPGELVYANHPDTGLSLRCALVVNRDTWAIVAAVFDPQVWSQKDAQKWLQENLEAAQTYALSLPAQQPERFQQSASSCVDSSAIAALIDDIHGKNTPSDDMKAFVHSIKGQRTEDAAVRQFVEGIRGHSKQPASNPQALQALISHIRGRKS